MTCPAMSCLTLLPLAASSWDMNIDMGHSLINKTSYMPIICIKSICNLLDHPNASFKSPIIYMTIVTVTTCLFHLMKISLFYSYWHWQNCFYLATTWYHSLPLWTNINIFFQKILFSDINSSSTRTPDKLKSSLQAPNDLCMILASPMQLPTKSCNLLESSSWAPPIELFASSPKTPNKLPQAYFKLLASSEVSFCQALLIGNT